MSEQEIKKQIQSDAAEWAEQYMDDERRDHVQSAFQLGEYHQDKIATNRTVEAALALINKSECGCGSLFEEIEKLRR
jgi:hypothetical protein